ncbi:hypothetical protein CEUSTIGMA_g3245.t1 [Chlamydomonas eustigma]|uniref:Sfi1 spindle body domain-containing protein n=1 Tax=Chlamydomonas eustigma TaxID=1157962 RepID=A0A250WYW4_9CHLO|nr:hypothetical protein CEUSTIGMA_g3245.t1 [Chlamydomonas eustigma]|eukprot:GAX75802.1 hypothetical protein CEUSTIGMA_g3245.t1 [Chlamydomonas eustigma]
MSTATRFLSPQNRGLYRDVRKHADSKTMDTLMSLPGAEYLYSEYDLGIIAEILTTAEYNAQLLVKKGKGNGDITLQRLLKAYEVVLPKYQVKPQEDIYYYRFLLKLSLDPEPNWWAKFYREAQGYLSAQLPRPSSPSKHGSLHSLSTFHPDTVPELDTWRGRGSSNSRTNNLGTAAGTAAADASGRRNSAGGGGAGVGGVAAAGSAVLRAANAGTPTNLRRPANQRTFLNPASEDVTALALNAVLSARAAIGQHSVGSDAYHASQNMGGGNKFTRSAVPTVRMVEKRFGTWGGGTDDDVSEGGDSEAEAYADFQCTARSFRTWREQTIVLKESREAREAAVQNWNIALAFWEVNLAKRLFHSWATHKHRVLSAAVEKWTALGLSTYFRRWHEVASYLKVAGVMSGQHSVRRVKRKCLQWWRQYTILRDAKNSNMSKALMLWTGNTKESVFRSWLMSTQHAIAADLHADSYYSLQACGKLLRLWQSAAARMRQLKLAGGVIRSAHASRLITHALTAWQLNNKIKSTMRVAIASWTHSSLRRSWNAWSELLAEGGRHKKMMEKALFWWTHRCLREAWGSWKLLVQDSHDKLACADEHFIASQSLRLRRVFLLEWKVWADEQVQKNQRLYAVRELLYKTKQWRSLKAWRALTVRRRMDLAAFDILMRREVRRLTITAAQCLYKVAHDQSRAEDAAGSIERSLAVRVMRHWSTLTRFKLLRAERRGSALQQAQHKRKSRLFHAFRLVIAVRSEQKRLVEFSRERKTESLRHLGFVTLRGYALQGRMKRKKLLAAMQHWQRSVKFRIAKAWLGRLVHGRSKRWRWNSAVLHSRTRVLQNCMAVWLETWQIGQIKLDRALNYRQATEDAHAIQLLHAWRAVTTASGAKQNKLRRAVAFWIGQRLAIGFYSWHAWKEMSMIEQAKMKAALLMWLRKTLTKTFAWWKDHAANKILRHRKSRAYLSLLLSRVAAFSLFMLRANAQRKHKSRACRVHRLRRVLSTAFHGWLMRTVLKGELMVCMQNVLRQILGLTLNLSFSAWRSYVMLRHDKRRKAGRALGHWLRSSLRHTFNTLRWYHLSHQMGRALALKYRYSMGVKALMAWHEVASYQIGCKTKILLLWNRTDLKRLQEGWTSWIEWVQLKRAEQLGHTLAVTALINRLLLKAWNSWIAHHANVLKARWVTLHMLNMRMASAFNAWVAQVMAKREILERMEGIIARMQNQALNKAFNNFLFNVENKYKKRAARAHYFENRVRLMFKAWRVGSKLDKALAWWMDNTLRTSFMHWLSLVKYKENLHLTLQRVAKKWLNLSMSSAFHTWRSKVEEVKHRREMALRGILHWQHRHLSAAFGGWRDYMLWIRHMEQIALTIMYRLSHSLILRSFNSWRYFMALRMNGHMADRHAVVKLYQKCFLPWADRSRRVADAKERAEELFSSICNQRASTTLSGVFAKWRSAAKQSAKLRLVLQLVMGKYLELAFYGWSEIAADKVQRRKDFTRLQATLAEKPQLEERCLYSALRWAAWPKSLAFYTWLSIVRESQELSVKAAMAVLSFTGHTLRKSWIAWCGYTTDQVIKRHKLRRALLMLGGLRKVQCLYWWLALTQYLRHMRSSFETIQAKGNARRKRTVWSVWCSRVQYARVARKAIAMLAYRTKLEVLIQWRKSAVTKKENRAKVFCVVSKILNRTLALAIQTWKDWTKSKQKTRPKKLQVVSRLRNLVLFRAWSAWKSFTEEKLYIKYKLAVVIEMWTNRTLAKSFNKWVDMWQERCKGTLALVHFYGGLLDKSWLSWRQFVEFAELEKGDGAKKKLIFSRVMTFWRAFAVRSIKSRSYMIRLYQRKALQGWYSNVLRKQHQRAFLLHAAQNIMFGMLARTFLAWLAFVSERHAKQVVFAQKQRALSEALKFGERVRLRQNAELTAAVFQAWRFKVGIFRKVSMRFASVTNRMVQSFFGAWRLLVMELRAHLHIAIRHHNSRLVGKVFSLWNQWASVMHKVTLEHAEISEEHRYFTYVGKAMHAWSKAVHLGMLQRAALVKVMESNMLTENQALLRQAMEAWGHMRQRRIDLASMVDMASMQRRFRIMASVLDVWRSYTVAMRRDLDPGSPFLAPRSPQDDRNLIRHVASSLVGGKKIESSSDGSSRVSADLDFDSPEARHQREVSTRRSAYFRIASPERAQRFGLGGPSGPPSTVMSLSTTAAGMAQDPHAGLRAAAGMPGVSFPYHPPRLSQDLEGMLDDHVSLDPIYNYLPHPAASRPVQSSGAMSPQQPGPSQLGGSSHYGMNWASEMYNTVGSSVVVRRQQIPLPMMPPAALSGQLEPSFRGFLEVPGMVGSRAQGQALPSPVPFRGLTPSTAGTRPMESSHYRTPSRTGSVSGVPATVDRIQQPTVLDRAAQLQASRSSILARALANADSRR